ncbi:cryptochrome/photolyase family protein [Paraburkholderia pallida]|uniref:cryptochrome/photolyase family protein n=1 Tax=Paraburkholderia pallida TaxID=2547399 RepID=UPI003AB62491
MRSRSTLTSAQPVHAPVVVWFRDDLRLADQPALAYAAATGRPLICLYVHDPQAAGERPPGGAARWWLHETLRALDAALRERGGRLLLMQGPESEMLEACVAASGAAGVFWNRRYGGNERDADARLKARLRARGLEAESFNGTLLYEPWTVLNQSGESFQVFTAWWRACRRAGDPPPPLPAPQRWNFQSLPARLTQCALKLDDLGFAPHKPDWAGGLRETWPAGEEAALERLSAFFADDFEAYADERDAPGLAVTSRLSPYLRVGALSPRQVYAALKAAQHDVKAGSPASRETSAEKFSSELGWREFCYYQRYHYPDLAQRNLRPAFDAMPWRRDARGLRAWQRGLTGYPFVDAGMRELWRTGWMHNRVRMVTASFATKHLLLDWRAGEQWFWDTLVDADPASNPANWQWVAGSGVDAAPYFRIFNPVLQGQKFDPRGAYIREWVPELASLPDRLIHQPWKASQEDLEAAGVRLGVDYPLPVVEHELARARALEAFAKTGKARGKPAGRGQKESE